MTCKSSLLASRIAEIAQHLDDGTYWCPCVETDYAKARAKAAEGNCSSAMYHAKEALMRCTGSSFDLNAHGPTEPEPEQPFNDPTSFELFSPLELMPVQALEGLF